MKHAARDALLDEYARALWVFARCTRDLDDEALDKPVPGKDPTLRDVLAHVVDAAYRHVEYVARACGGRVPPRKYELDALRHLEAVRAGLQDATSFARAALDGVDDDALRGPRFPGRGGGDYDGEQMLEHAVVHPYRHLRQLRRLGLLPQTSLDDYAAGE